jgi:acyl dehydratase
MTRPDGLYFDDLGVGQVFTFGPYRVTRSEMLEFNARWDPLPIHLDDHAARARGLAGITASGQYTLCVKQVLLNRAPWTTAVIGALGFDELRFPHPVYPEDALNLRIECLELRASRSKPDRGIVKFSFVLSNQHEVAVLRYLDTVMFARRSRDSAVGA